VAETETSRRREGERGGGVRRERQQTIGKMHGIIHRALGVVGVKAVVG
jgi:hypothetical protein